MNKIKILSLLFFFLIFLGSCEKIDPPYKEKHDGGDLPPEQVVKKVLLEDYTGHRCTNCAGAAQTAHDLQEVYNEQLIIMSVHAGNFAQPLPGSIFTADYRTEAGNIWNDFFGVQQYPSGMVNRMTYNGELVLTENKWGEAVSNALKTEADAVIKIKNSFSAGVVTSDISVKFLHDMPGTYNLQVCLLEDSLVSPQLNNDENAGDVPVIENFVFMHMLRGAVNGPWGEDIFDNPVLPNKEYQVIYHYTVPGVAKNSHIVAFVYSQNDKSVVQVEDAAVIPEE